MLNTLSSLPRLFDCGLRHMNCSLLALGWKWSCLWNCAERILDIKAFLKHAKEIAKKYWWFKRLMTEEEINRWMTELTELNKNIGHVFDNSQGQTDKHGQKAALMSDFRKSNKTEVHVDEKFGWNWGTHLSGVGGWREAEGGPGGPLGVLAGDRGGLGGVEAGTAPAWHGKLHHQGPSDQPPHSTHMHFQASPDGAAHNAQFTHIHVQALCQLA